MNKRRNIYRGINKRRNNVAKGAVLGLAIIGIVGGAIYLKNSDFSLYDKIKDLSLFNKASLEIQEFTYDDIEKKDNKDQEEKNSTVVKNEDSKLATVENWDLYSIQIAAIDNQEELKKIDNKLKEMDIPFSIIEIDKVKKVQTYASFKEEESRKYLEQVKAEFPDAFISKLEVPLLSLQYTDKYSYVEDICNELNNLITNFKEESGFWDKNEGNIDQSEYKNIINSRMDILSKLEKQAKKIDYKGMDGFKENLLNYTKSVRDKSEESLKLSQENKNNISKSLFMSSMQGYYNFVNSIKTI
ncbi:hypothetical protein [Paraclostridium bifermentans]|uniref:hypothetical protein n=1 Tax=Paraclostridium bifermentans TaxID=1490 RepID=UPI00359CA135